MDWTATILAASGTPAGSMYPLDGEDLLPICAGTRTNYSRSFFWRTQDRAAARVGKWKYLNESGNDSLFDLSVDPGEKNDLGAAHADVLAQLTHQYAAWNARMLPRLPPI